ncbi:hypothetical protein GXM_00079 [Nostoc sphaeroides CCNUC1]|uniref:Uncharacterized protein n=1 Tax=Nostoc sphaeroides CCNUC1 TaxID=2653204 RepID=A0A5P8VQU9_9NOSO|nr:hypothetical protein GXM_00079 [Nostoc sphaeroides CCNUC1]
MIRISNGTKNLIEKSHKFISLFVLKKVAKIGVSPLKD